MEAHEITTRLPPRHEDEPESLRQDIVDEILDHLQCGLRRELLIQGGDEASAKERVLRRFGDPREIARKLWFQAMWSKIMSQRIAVGSALFSMLVCAVLVGMMGWMLHQQQLSAAQQQRANTELMERIVGLIKPSQQTETYTDSEPRKSHLQVKVTVDTEDGPAATKCILTVKKQPELGWPVSNGGDAQQFALDPSGMADCGLTEPGRFEVTIRTAFNEVATSSFTIPSQQDHVEHIVVPGKLPEMTKVIFRIDELPNDLDLSALGLVMRLRPHGSRTVGGRAWRATGRWPNVSMPLVLLGLGNEQHLGVAVEPEASSSPFTGIDEWIVPIDDVIKHGKWNPSEEWSLPAGEYDAQFGLANLQTAPVANNYWNNLDGSGRICTSVWLRKNHLRFQVEHGKLNELTIQLPDYVSMCTRDQSKIREVCEFGASSGMSGGGMGGGMQPGSTGGGTGFF